MPDNHRTATVVSNISLTSNEYGIELNNIPINNDSHINESNRNSSHRKDNSIVNQFQNFLTKFDCLKVEKRDIDRILPEERTDSTVINTAMIWVGANIVMPCFATGTLGPAVFKLNLYDSFLTIIIFNLLASISVAAMACFGPASSLRTMVFSRYSWGYYGASIMSVLNIIAALGWTAVNSITGAQTLRVVSNDSLSIAIGIIIISIISMIVSFVGYKWIHTYERYSWIPVFIAFCIVAGVGAKYYVHSEMVSLNETIPYNKSHRLKISGILSFDTSCFGASISWCSFAGDYNTYFPENTSQLKIFFLTYIGNSLSMISIELLGAAVYSGTYINQNWKYAYEINNVDGLLGACISSLSGFGKFLLILFSLSIIASNILNIYSLSLSVQVIASLFKCIPRIVYTVVGTGIYIILGIIAANKFNDSLVSFMDVISYGFSIFIVIVFEDHLLFRRCSYKNYDFNIWNNRKLLPISLSAIFSGLIGIIGIIIGMSQTWFHGPISKAISDDNGQHGADLGFQFGFIFTAITFPLFRLIEQYIIK